MRYDAKCWLGRRLAMAEKRRAAELAQAARLSVKISLVVPVFNTPEDFLRGLIESVCCQTYGRWELCLGDASDGSHGYVAHVIDGYAAKDHRVRRIAIAENGGISRNTNAALAAATGEVIAFLDHDDLLHPSALLRLAAAFETQDAEFVYTDEGSFDSETGEKVSTNFKPDFSPDLLKGVNYICHLSAFRRTLMDRSGGALRPEYDGSQDHDLFLRLTAQTDRIVHIPEMLYFWRAHAGSTASSAQAKPYTGEAGRRAIQAALDRNGKKGIVTILPGWQTFYRVRYEIERPGKVSVIVPTRNHFADLKTCLDSIFEKTLWRDYEIVILDNGSDEPELLRYYEDLRKRSNAKVVICDEPFNFSRINNHAVRHATGDYLLFLNNDTEVISPEWLDEMLMYAQRDDVGAVGAKLLYSDDTIQHGGVIVGLGGVAGHAYLGQPRDYPGYAARALVVNDLSAVTAACLMMRRTVFDEIGGFDETFAVAFNDIDLCMRVRATGRLVVWTPFAELHHFESKSRGYEDTPEKIRRFQGEIGHFRALWSKELAAGDPYYNLNLALDKPAFEEKDWNGDEGAEAIAATNVTLPLTCRKVSLLLSLCPYGFVCKWLRKRHGIVVDQPLLHYAGTVKRIKRVVKFALPYWTVYAYRTRSF